MRGAMLTALAVMLAVPAVAQDLAQCVPGADAPLADVPVDLGQGIVAQHLYAGAVDVVPDALVLITDCESGGRIIAALPEIEGQQRTPDEVIRIMATALEAEETFSAGDVAEAMTLAGAPAQVRMTAAEDCGCALLYPELRGDKPAWEAE